MCSIPASQELIRHVLQLSPLAVICISSEGIITWANDAASTMLGYEVHELQGNHMARIAFKDETAIKSAAHNPLHYFYQSEHTPTEYVFFSRQGEPVQVRFRSVVIRDSEGRPAEVAALFEPMRSDAESGAASASIAEKMWQAQQNFENVLTHSADAIVICDISGNIVQANHAFCSMLGFSAEEVAGRHITEFVPLQEGRYDTTWGGVLDVDEAYVIQAAVKPTELYEAGVVSNWETHFVRKCGTVIPVAVTMSVLQDKDGDRRGSVVIARDSTGRIQTEQQLKEAVFRAEEASRSKSQFLANMSHEIRTPMNGVIGFTDILLETSLSDEQRDYAMTIKRSGEALLTLINDLLDFSKIEAGKIDFAAMDFDMELQAYDVCELIRPRIADRPIEILCRIDDQLPARVVGDPNRFKQVLTNLLGNAAKFTARGEIELALSVDEDVRDTVLVHARVRDTGIGIPDNKLKEIFEPFQQADGSITRQYGGTGLGLAICRKIALLMSGDVWAESSQGAGSTFHFTARLAKALDAPKRCFRQAEITDKKILLVDDNRTNLDVMSTMLSGAGMRPVACDTAEKTFDAIRAAQRSADPFALGILDIQMPETSGYDIARRLRDEGCAMPLIAFSSTFERNASQCREAGFNGYLPKPVNRIKLFRMIMSLIGAGIEQAGDNEPLVTQHSLREEAKQSVSVLLAEDNPVNQKLARTMLEKAGYRVTVAENGLEAVRIATEAPEHDLVFMDVHMPQMDGLQAAALIRQRGMQSLPIVAMTADAMKGDREKCLEAGMNDYISKPIKRDAVFAVIKRWVLDREEPGT